MEEKIYYLDNANTTFLSADVYKKILECYSRCQCDERSLYFFGRNSRAEILDAKIKIAKAIRTIMRAAANTDNKDITVDIR